jgi:hypothetical protein
MPFKHNGSRCHRIPTARRRMTNWPAYEGGLRQGAITVQVLNRMIRIVKPVSVRLT